MGVSPSTRLSDQNPHFLHQSDTVSTHHFLAMAAPTHSRRYRSSSSISIESMIDWYEEEDLMEEEVPHLLASIAITGSDTEECRSECHSSRPSTQHGDDPLSRRDSVFNPSPLVLSVRKIHPKEEAPIEPATFILTNATEIPRPRNVGYSDKTRCISESSTLSDSSDQSMTVCDTKSPRRHRRDSIDSLPADLREVLLSFEV